MDKLIPVAVLIIAVAVLAIAVELILRPCCCQAPQAQAAVTMFDADTVTIVPGDTVTVVPGDSLMRRRPGQPALLIPPNRAVLIPAR